MAPVTTTSVRGFDSDPLFDVSDLSMPGPGGGKQKRPGAKKSTPPYHVGNTWKAPNGDRQDYLLHCENLTAMQRHVAYFDAVSACSYLLRCLPAHVSPSNF